MRSFALYCLLAVTGYSVRIDDKQLDRLMESAAAVLKEKIPSTDDADETVVVSSKEESPMERLVNSASAVLAESSTNAALKAEISKGINKGALADDFKLELEQEHASAVDNLDD